MTNNNYILVGGYPLKDKEQHPGGQVTATRLLAEYAQEHNIKLNIIDTSQNSFPVPSVKDRLKSAFNRILKLKQLLKEKNINGVIIFSSTGFSFYEKVFMALIARIYKTKALLFIRSGHFIDLNKKNKIAKFLNKLLLKIPNYIGAQGNKWVEFYNEMNVDKSNIKLIHNWIKIYDDIDCKKNNHSVVFLFAGWIVEKKGVLELFDVIEENRDLDKYIFRFAGEGTLFEKLQKRKIDKNLTNIEMLGWMGSNELQEEYKKADVFILPSHAEGFPNVILEALNHRLPIISTNVGGIPDSVINEYNGYIIEPKDTKALYESIKKMGESFEKRLEFSQKSEKVLRENHDFNKTCPKVFNIFEEEK